MHGVDWDAMHATSTFNSRITQERCGNCLILIGSFVGELKLTHQCWEVARI
jgi:hypothetical protein